MPTFHLRRRFLQAAGLSGLALTAYSYQRGIRFPTLSWESASLPDQFDFDDLIINGRDVIQTPTTGSERVRFRAYAPEPGLVLHSKKDQVLNIVIGNIASDALLTKNAAKSTQETISGISRHITIELKRDETMVLEWQLPNLNEYTFAAIGDSGGDKELAWCIRRAAELGARFLLHLGDFNYQIGDYPRSIQLFNSSPIPCYVSIGNHDFQDDGLLYRTFLSEIGPLNHAFTIGKTRFINIDTAANKLPYAGGHRGRLLEQLSINNDGINNDDITDAVAFTHRPIHDPIPGSDHDLGSEGERDWLVAALKAAGITTLLSGHIHIYNRGVYYGIENIIAGQGLGHQDLIVNQDISKIVIGRVDQDGKIEYKTEPLAMPMKLHCHPRSDVVKETLVNYDHYDVIRDINQACKNNHHKNNHQ